MDELTWHTASLVHLLPEYSIMADHPDQTVIVDVAVAFVDGFLFIRLVPVEGEDRDIIVLPAAAVREIELKQP